MRLVVSIYGNLNMPKLPLPPGPKGHFFMANTLEFIRDPLTFFLKSHLEYGGICHFKIFSGHFQENVFVLFVFVFHILSGHQQVLYKRLSNLL